MKLKTKISFLLFSSLFLLFVAIFYNSIVDLRNASAKSAESQALATAKVIEAGLTAHMVSGTMDQRDTFINQVTSLENMKQLWLVRSSKVSHQYGKGPFAEDPRDGIDKSVLESGETVIESTGGIFEDATVRLSMPYKATVNGKLDCLSCHDVKSGDTLGVISIEMKTNDLKALSYRNIIIGSLLLMVLFGGMIYFLYKKVLIYFDRFEAMGKCARLVQNGDLTARVPPELSDDHDAKALNTLIEKFQTSLVTIKENLSGIIHIDAVADPLDAIIDGSVRLNDIAGFTHTLHRDANAHEAYVHIAHHFSDRFKIDDINLITYNPLSQETQIVYEKKEILCDAQSGCRAARTGETVDSSMPDGICPKMIIPNEHYVCVPYAINGASTLVVSMVSDKKSMLNNVREATHVVDETLHAIGGEIAHHQMREDIQKLQRIDPLSGLYTKNFLLERMFMIVKESKRTAIPYGVMILNVDDFTTINNVYGEKVGDETIRIIGRTLLDSLRESDVIARLSGDEFAVLLYDCDPMHVNNVGEKIRSLFANKKLKAHSSGFIKTMRIGTAIFPQQHKDIAQCLAYARLAMNEAKLEGGNRSVKFHTRLLESN
ncbi:MAG: GGDEF domain-containing protein [Epsilonproteobacteria bacterium]|nr:GGDEF domain-containing protein [Campylobacterota bacterium]